MPKVMWTGPEHERIIAKSDLGFDPEDDTSLVWSAATRFIQELTEEEFEKLKELTGPGTWDVVEVLEAGEGEQVGVTDSSPTNQGVPQKSPREGKKPGKTDEA